MNKCWICLKLPQRKINNNNLTNQPQPHLPPIISQTNSNSPHYCPTWVWSSNFQQISLPLTKICYFILPLCLLYLLLLQTYYPLHCSTLPRISLPRSALHRHCSHLPSSVFLCPCVTSLPALSIPDLIFFYFLLFFHCNWMPLSRHAPNFFLHRIYFLMWIHK